MKMRKICIYLYLFIISPDVSFANGGPIDLGHLRKTGNIRLLRNADVSLLKEDLKLKLIGDYTEIEVEYILQNNGKMQDIQYGFPVDAYAANWCYCPGFPPFHEEGNNFVEYFKIKLKKQELNVSHWVIDSVYSARSVYLKGSYTDDESYTIARKWYATTIRFQANEIKTLQVSYKLKNTVRDYVGGFHFVDNYADRHFTYHLTPSSNWGDGIVKDFNLTIDMTNLASLKTEYSIKGIASLKNNNHIHIYKTQNYDLKKSDRIDIHYNYNHVKQSAFIQKYQIPKNFITSIRCSSNDIDAKNLIDDQPHTTWTGKVGDWIEISFRKVKAEYDKNYNIIPQGIFALNGNYTNKDSFDKSGKISLAKVIVNDTLAFNNELWKLEEGSRIIKLDKPIFKEISEQDMKGLATVIADGDGLTPLENIEYIYKIRIEIIASSDKKVTLSDLYFVRYVRE